MNLENYKIISLYCFAPIEAEVIPELRNNLLKFEEYDITGLLILAKEGINGTLCGSEEFINQISTFIKDFLKNYIVNEKISFSRKKIFKKLKVKVKKEIVTMGITEVDPRSQKGTYIDPKDWNKFIEDENTLVIDTRNHYEVNLGTFKKSINPKTNNFREFPDWVNNNLEKFIGSKKTKNIAMFCTGGIRCEKATSLLVNAGYENVFHLKGGILKYIEEIPPEISLFNGECYVFDGRVSLNNKLLEGNYSICHACGMPISEEDKKRDEFKMGIQCHYCINKFSDKDRERFAERQKQIDNEKIIKQ